MVVQTSYPSSPLTYKDPLRHCGSQHSSQHHRNDDLYGPPTNGNRLHPLHLYDAELYPKSKQQEYNPKLGKGLDLHQLMDKPKATWPNDHASSNVSKQHRLAKETTEQAAQSCCHNDLCEETQSSEDKNLLEAVYNHQSKSQLLFMLRLPTGESETT
jgi:hypothetical protein